MQTHDTQRARRATLAIAGLGIASHVVAVLLAASRIDGYIAASHPVALLGARGVAEASVFNLFAFVLPGLCAAACAWRSGTALGRRAAWWSRIGSHMLLLAGLAFAGQGVWTLDLDELDGGRSRGHATAWMLWVVATVAGGSALALGSAMGRRWIRAIACVMAATAVLLASVGALPLDPGVAQRVGVLAWGVLVLVLAWAGAARGRQAEVARRGFASRG